MNCKVITHVVIYMFLYIDVGPPHRIQVGSHINLTQVCKRYMLVRVPIRLIDVSLPQKCRPGGK